MDNEATAELCALAWLKLVDDGRTAEAWDAGSPLLTSAFTKARAVTIIQESRGRLGPLLERRKLSRRLVHELPDAPLGIYVLLEFQSRFQRQGTFKETVTMVSEPKGWQVAGYFMVALKQTP